MTVFRCDYCGKIASMNHHWHKMVSGAEFCSWRCMKLYAEYREKQDEEYEKETREG